jgi:hypothetical protein
MGYRVKNKTQIWLSETLINRVQQEVTTSQGAFHSVEEYIEFILTELFQDEKPQMTTSQADEEDIKQRLRSLGYLG